MSIKSIKQVLNTVPKRVVAILGLVVAIVIPMAVQAWGPGKRQLFTMQNPADYITFNSITDNPRVGAEPNFLKVSRGNNEGYSDSMTMEDGKTYYIYMYVHNNAKARLNLVSTNTRAHIDLPTGANQWKTWYEINGYLWADNAKPNEIWDNILLRSNKEFHIEVLSAKYYNNIRTEATSGFDLGRELYTSQGRGTGALLGYQQMDGRIPGCLEYSGYVLVKFRPVFKTTPPPPPEKPQPGYDIEKTVDKTTAKPGETINYTITAKNTGKEDLTNVKITDKLPKNYDKASEKVDAPSTITGSIIKNGEVTIAKLPVGTKATIKISYTIKKNIDCGKHIIKNIAHGTTDQDKTEDSSGNNEVTTIVDVDCKPGYDIEKTVDKTTAKPGETINYTITAKNTGKEDLTNVKITDKLPKNYDKASEKVDAPSTITGSIIKNGEVTIAKLPVGTKATIKISYTIKKNIDCGKHIIKNIAHGTTDQDKTEDSSGNNEVTTIVDVDCKPNVPPTTPPNTPPTTPPAPTTPSVIAQTGTSDNTIAAILGLGTLAGALTAYIRSRKYANR